MNSVSAFISRHRQLILWILAILLTVAAVLIFIVGLPWKHQLDQCFAEIKARGEPLSVLDLQPKPVPAEDNGAPLLEALARDIEGEACFTDGGSFAQLTQKDAEWLAAGKSPEKTKLKTSSTQQEKLRRREQLFQHWQNLAALNQRHPTWLTRLDTALRKPHFLFSLDYHSSDLQLPHLELTRKLQSLLMDWTTCQKILGHRQEAQSCRLLSLRFPHTLDETPFSARYRVLSGSLLFNRLFAQLPDLTLAELGELRDELKNLRPITRSGRDILIEGRIGIAITAAMTGEQMRENYFGFEPGVKSGPWNSSSLYIYTFLRQRDLLAYLHEYQALIDGKTPVVTSRLGYYRIKDVAFLAKMPRFDHARLQLVRLGVDLEMAQRQAGRYPADLSSFPLPPELLGQVQYEVFPGGAGAFLKFLPLFDRDLLTIALGKTPATASTHLFFSPPLRCGNCYGIRIF